MTGSSLGSEALMMDAPQNWLSSLRAYLAATAVGNLAWESVHLPLYTLWRNGSARDNLFAVLHCTLGDLLIALSSLTLALVISGHRDWPTHHRSGLTATLTVAFGLSYTAFSEWLNIVVRKSWAYSDLMPVFPVFGFEIGFSPLLQWIVVPAVALHLAGCSGGPQQAPGSTPV